jgi:hypothetical protein
MTPFLDGILGLKLSAMNKTMKYAAQFFALTTDFTAPD